MRLVIFVANISNMANCNGKAAGSSCGSIIFRCAKCGLSGCKNVRNGQRCNNNITRDSGGMCRSCGGTLKVA
jgi:hypothetical protein